MTTKKDIEKIFPSLRQEGGNHYKKYNNGK